MHANLSKLRGSIPAHTEGVNHKKKKIHISIETKCYIPEPLKGLLTAHHRCQTDA